MPQVKRLSHIPPSILDEKLIFVMLSYPPSISLSASRHASGVISLPGSKSLSNRALLLAALSEGKTKVINVLNSDDTAVMLQALEKLGILCQEVIDSDSPTYIVHGKNGNFPCRQADIFVGNAGTVVRPLVAALAIVGGEYSIYGVPRMHERPIGDLIDALCQMGTKIEYLEKKGFPPLIIHQSKVNLPPVITIKGNVSSQFLTSLLMTVPLIHKYKARDSIDACTIQVKGELISRPYIGLTIDLLSQFGVVIDREGWNIFTVPLKPLCSPGEIFIEGDASSASYFLAAGAIAGGPIRVNGVGNKSSQGDIAFLDALKDMGAETNSGDNWLSAASPKHGNKLKAIDIDCNHMPDAAMTLAVVALFASGRTKLSGIGSWRVKETDRIEAMADGLKRLGAFVEIGEDFITIEAPNVLNENVSIDTYEDHRIAMCFALARFAGVDITINNPSCVAKTFPNFFDFLESVV